MRLRGRNVLCAYSGGLDSAALAYRLQALGAHVVPYYIDYRTIRHSGKTVTDIACAKASAALLGLPEPIYLRAYLEPHLRHMRNRHFIRVLVREASKHHTNVIALGTLHTKADDDIDPAILKKDGVLYDMRVVTWDDFGVREKADEIRDIPPEDRAFLVETTSCQRPTTLECGGCYSCKARHQAFLRAYGYDLTEYKRSPDEH